MHTETSHKQYTYQDYLKLDDDNRYELIGGEVLLAPTDVLLSEKEKPQPDIFFIAKERLNIIKEQHIAGARFSY